MLDFDEYKQLLGKYAEKMSDEEITAKLEWDSKLASILFDMWLEAYSNNSDIIEK